MKTACPSEVRREPEVARRLPRLHGLGDVSPRVDLDRDGAAEAPPVVPHRNEERRKTATLRRVRDSDRRGPRPRARRRPRPDAPRGTGPTGRNRTSRARRRIRGWPDGRRSTATCASLPTAVQTLTTRMVGRRRRTSSIRGASGARPLEIGARRGGVRAAKRNEGDRVPFRDRTGSARAGREHRRRERSPPRPRSTSRPPRRPGRGARSTRRGTSRPGPCGSRPRVTRTAATSRPASVCMPASRRWRRKMKTTAGSRNARNDASSSLAARLARGSKWRQSRSKGRGFTGEL